MNKGILIGCMVVSLIVAGIMVFGVNQQVADLEIAFKQWNQGTVTTTEAVEIMEQLLDYLIKHPDIGSEELQSISPQLKLFDEDPIKIIEYIENPEFYGSSARGSYHLLIYGDKGTILDQDGSMEIERILKVEDQKYLIFVTNYQFSNMTGIDIYSLTLDQEHLNFESLLETHHLLEGFTYQNALYYQDAHIYYDSIGEQEITIKVGEGLYFLKLNDQNRYQLSQG